ncbi:hypothetical protein SDC9_119390 [bioreactor metagenome]|uniref:Uncharacterized protein n=1 Tax=bioreactor metagenome TaxID=1076179 RepID=A0A645C9F5_9ZZZZ
MNVAQIVIIIAVSVDTDGLTVCVVDKAQCIRTVTLAHELIACIDIFRRCAAGNLLCSQTAGIVFERQICTVAVDGGKLSAFLPCVSIAVIGQRISDGIIGNRFAIVGSHFVFPVCVAISIIDGFGRCAQITCRVGIFNFTEDIAIAIVSISNALVQPSIVFADQLVKTVIGVTDFLHIIFTNSGDIVVTVIHVIELAVCCRDDITAAAGIHFLEQNLIDQCCHTATVNLISVGSIDLVRRRPGGYGMRFLGQPVQAVIRIIERAVMHGSQIDAADTVIVRIVVGGGGKKSAVVRFCNSRFVTAAVKAVFDAFAIAALNAAKVA